MSYQEAPQDQLVNHQVGPAGDAVHQDIIAKWSNMCSKKPMWSKLNQNTWYSAKNNEKVVEMKERRFPDPLPKGQNPSYDKIQQRRQKLIIAEYKKMIINQVMSSPVTILSGETGCGKSTQVVQYLVEAGLADKGCIAVTEPRRVAATALSRRVADETNTKLGEEVGYKIRFDDNCSEKTIVKYMTDGVLLRECINCSDLSQYSVVIVDEAHERSINIDVLLGLLRNITKVRGDFKIVVMSATIDVDKFSAFFNRAQILKIPGKSYNVEIFFTQDDDNITSYHKPSENNLIESVTTTVNYVVGEMKPDEPGDVLVFLYGQDIIEEVCRELRQGETATQLVVLPLYRALPTEQQNRIFDPAPRGMRKVIVATNIAESSLTIDGVKYVIDSGFMRVMKYSSINEVENLEVRTITHEHADQRTGRAGRTQPGYCYRLYTEEYYISNMLKHQVPELLRSNMVGTMLQIKAIGVKDILTFDFLDPPKMSDMIQAHQELLKLNAIKSNGMLTLLGEKMALFPIDPYLAKLLLVAAYKWHCSEEMVSIVAMLSCLPILLRPRDIGAGDGSDPVAPAKKNEIVEADIVEDANVDDLQSDSDGEGCGITIEVEDTKSLDPVDATDADVVECLESLVDATVALFGDDPEPAKETVVDDHPATPVVVASPPAPESDGLSKCNIPFYRPEGDLIAMLDAYKGFIASGCSQAWCHTNNVHYRSISSAKEVREQLIRIMSNKRDPAKGIPLVSCGDDPVPIQRTIAEVMYYNLAVISVDEKKKIAYHPLAKPRTFPTSHSSVLRDDKPDYVIYNKLIRRGQVYMIDLTKVEKEWFDFPVPQPYTVDVDKHFKNSVMTNKAEDCSMRERILYTYNPTKYGSCPLDAERELQEKLEKERKDNVARMYAERTSVNA